MGKKGELQCLVFTVSAELTNVRRRQYVDPSEYDNIQEAVRKFARELDPNMLTLENLIGGGKKKQCTVSRNRKRSCPAIQGDPKKRTITALIMLVI